MKLLTFVLLLIVSVTSVVIPDKTNSAAKAESEVDTSKLISDIANEVPDTEPEALQRKGFSEIHSRQDPRCRRDSDCYPGTCFNGICTAPIQAARRDVVETRQDPRCRRDSDCYPGTCFHGICIAPAQ